MLLFRVSNTNHAKTVFKIISRNREYVKTQCNDLYNPFHFACRR